MSVESAADRAVFLADFNAAAVYTPSGGVAVSIAGVFDAPFEAAGDALGAVGVSSSRPQWMCRTADLTGTIVGGTLAFGGTTYTIVEHEPDGTGMSVLFLEEQS